MPMRDCSSPRGERTQSILDEHGTFVGGYTLRVTMDRIGNTSGDRDNVHGGIPFRDLDGPESPGN